MSPSTTRDAALKWSAYALLILLLLFVHSMTFGRLRILGVSPFLPPLLLATAASMEDRLEGAVFGLNFGMLCDLSLAAPVPCLYTIAFTAAALLASFMAGSVLQPGFLCSLVVSAAAFALVDLVLAAVLLLSGRADPLAVLSRAARELIVSLPLLLVCHPAFLFLHRRFTL